MDKSKVLRGIIVDVKEAGESSLIEGERWKKVIFTIKLLQFSKRATRRKIPEDLIGKEVKVVRYAHNDWHYRTGVPKTLTAEETEAVLKGTQTETVFW